MSTETNPVAETVQTPDGFAYHCEGFNEPLFCPNDDVRHIIDAEGDVWVENPFTGAFYLPQFGTVADNPNTATITEAEIAEEYGYGYPSSARPAPAFTRGDRPTNTLSGREALVLSSTWSDRMQTYLYIIFEKGFIFPPGCGPIPGSGTFAEEYLEDFGEEPFGEEEVTILTMFYSLPTSD